MSQPPDEKLSAWLQYFNDLGIRNFYRSRQTGSLALRKVTSARPASRTQPPSPSPAPSPNVPIAPASHARFVGQTETKTLGLFETAAPVDNDSLDKIRADIGADCRRCKLCERRTHIVFSDGSPNADIVFVGEGPGHDEDVQGIPFVGRAGQLLTQMIEAMGLKRQQVYICNVVKCRPPENRVPEPDEIATCSPFLFRQLEVIRPKVIVGLGAVAVKTLLASNVSITKIRGDWYEFKGIPLMPTYHPAYLLRNPNAKPDAWKDLQSVMKRLGLEPPKRK